MYNVKQIFSYLLFVLGLSLLAVPASAQNPFKQLEKETEGGFNFILATDLGRNGYYDQKAIAETMGELAGELDAEFIVSQGDLFHYIGIQSTTDPLWQSNFEQVYKHPELQLEWYPVPGNHEYRGAIQPLIDYTKISRRWCMPDRYFAKKFVVDQKDTLLLILIDTPPIIDKYRNDPETYPEACLQDRKAQLHFIDSTLTATQAKYKIVLGHHPVFAETSKDDNERADMQKYLLPILDKHNVHFYSAGHIHNFQHIQRQGHPTDFVVISSGSKSRKVKPIEGTKYCNGSTGFGFVSIKNGTLSVYFLDKDGNILYKINKPTK